MLLLQDTSVELEFIRNVCCLTEWLQNQLQCKILLYFKIYFKIFVHCALPDTIQFALQTLILKEPGGSGKGIQENFHLSCRPSGKGGRPGKERITRG